MSDTIELPSRNESTSAGLLAQAFVVTSVLLGGCATAPYSIDLMPAPDVYEEGVLDPFSNNALASAGPEAGLLYATDRAPALEGDNDRFYSSERGHVLRLGWADVELATGGIPWEEVRRISLLKNRTDKYPLRVAQLEEFGVLDSSVSVLHDQTVVSGDARAPAMRFAAAVDEKLARSRRKDILVYVHGFKVNFENPLLVTAELWHFLGYEGVSVAYSWPATPSVWAYVSDLETAAYAARQLRVLLAFLAQETDASRINIVGYSAGTRVIMEALSQLALLHAHREKADVERINRIGQVVLVGSDIDRDIFGGQILDGVLNVPEHLSIYLSDTDKALGVSQWLFGQGRIGQMIDRASVSPEVAKFLFEESDISLIDVTNAQGAGTGNGHAYFRDSPWVSSDILVSLMFDLDPAERGLVREEGSPIWHFPPDYIAHLRGVVERGRAERLEADATD